MDLTPGPGEDQERSEEVEASYLYLHRELDVDRTVEISGSVHVDLDMAARVYGVERIGGVVDFDTLLSVLDVLPQKIQESAYRAGREEAARDLERLGRKTLFLPTQLAHIARGDQPRTPQGDVAQTPTSGGEQ